MEELARAVSRIACFLKRDLQRLQVVALVKVDLIAIATGSGRVASGEDGRARRSAVDATRVGIEEGNAACRKAVHVRRVGLLETHRTDPIVEIVHGDEENIGRSLSIREEPH